MVLNAKKNFVGQQTQTVQMLIEHHGFISDLKFDRENILKTAVPQFYTAKIRPMVDFFEFSGFDQQAILCQLVGNACGIFVKAPKCDSADDKGKVAKIKNRGRPTKFGKDASNR